MARLPVLTRDQVPEQFLDAFEEETSASGGVVDSGPGSVMIHSPEMRRRANHFVGYFREVTDLPHKLQELAMLLTARHMDCQYIWYAHAARGRAAGPERRAGGRPARPEASAGYARRTKPPSWPTPPRCSTTTGLAKRRSRGP